MQDIKSMSLLCPDHTDEAVSIGELHFFYLWQRRRCMFLPTFVCLSVCLSVSKITQKMRAWIWMKCCVSTDVGTWMNWLTFEPDLECSPDARTGLLSSILYALQCGIILCRENPTYTYRLLQRCMVLKWFYSPRAVGTTLSEVRALQRVPF